VGGTVKGIEYLDQVNNYWLLTDSAVSYQCKHELEKCCLLDKIVTLSALCGMCLLTAVE